MRKSVVAGNWKMNKTASEAEALAEGIKIELANETKVDVILCPTFTALKSVADVISGSNLKLGAQNMHWENGGAYTGEIAPGMLRDLYCKYVILGHSERRQYFGETDDVVTRRQRRRSRTVLPDHARNTRQREAGTTK